MSQEFEGSKEKKVVDLTAFKKKKETEKEISRARRPLYVNQNDGTISGHHGQKTPDVPERLMKIRSSLDRINQLMAEIKKISANHSKADRLS